MYWSCHGSLLGIVLGPLTGRELINIRHCRLSKPPFARVVSFLSQIRKANLMLIYHCPTTARVVHSSIEASEADVRRLSAMRLSLWCPYCQLGHAVLGKDMQVAKNVVPSAA